MGKGEHLGEFEQLALLAVLRLDGDAYGAEIRREIEETADRSTSISAVYITLTRLEEKGFVRSRMGKPTSVRGGKAKRYFAVTEAGEAALLEARSRMTRMWDGVELGSASKGGAVEPRGA